MKNFLIASALSFAGLNGYAQNATEIDTIEKKQINTTKTSRLDFNVGIETSHLWRGLVINDGMTATGNIHYALNESQTIKVGFWGGAGFDGTYHEIDYYVQYQKNNLSIAIWDLFNTTGIETPKSFNYDKLTTTHLIDLRTSYRFPKNFPLRIEADIILYSGLNDRELNNNNEYRSKNSTYIELSYPLISDQKVNLNAFIGAALPLHGSKHLYTTKTQTDFDIVNTGITASKNIEIFNYKLPVSATAMWNPANKIARIKLDVNLF
ncbi:hypothetical protein [Flavobacterium sp. 7A]|uniref:hypothetical protein n=1 Tax=Flavobacterium sp. 7A TaxID=2940571 RepID=UPI00222637E8|nr:hypothetical protein [Flavobacterium sp. 7A]MCW2119077.1 hypothetical protein [Flavobacterium sp. 7A]